MRIRRPLGLDERTARLGGLLDRASVDHIEANHRRSDQARDDTSEDIDLPGEAEVSDGDDRGAEQHEDDDTRRCPREASRLVAGSPASP